MVELVKLKKIVAKLAEKVYDTLKEGYAEDVYEQALAIELRKNNIPYSIERNVEVLYNNERIGIDRLDFIVDEKLVVELKAISKLSKGNVAQLKAYLRVLNLKNGLLINFPVPFDEVDIMEVQNDEYKS